MNTFNKYTGRGLWLAAFLLPMFMTGCFLDDDDDTPVPIPVPTVTATSPADAAIAVALNKKVTATFSEAMNATTIDTLSFTVVGLDESALTGSPISYDATSKTASFTPNSNFTPSTVYTATLTTDVKSSAGKALAADYVWSFTSGTAIDDVAPTVISTNPADTATDIAIDSSVSANFSEALDPATVDTTSFTLTADSGATEITGVVSYSNKVATFNPTDDLVASTLYTATLTTAITDLADPANALAADVVWSFTTGTGVATGPAAINLRTAENFAIVAASTITSAGSTTITGDIALSPAAGSFITAACPEIVGEVYTVDAGYSDATCVNSDKGAAAIAIADVLAAYTAASDPATPAAVGPPNLELGTGTVIAQTLAPGVYTWGGDVTITGEITLDGSATDVWIFQIGGTLDTNQAIILAGALAKNVFWQVAGTVSLNPGAQFQGIVLAKTNIDMKDGATISGRLLAQTAVTLGTTTVVTQPAP